MVLYFHVPLGTVKFRRRSLRFSLDFISAFKDSVLNKWLKEWMTRSGKLGYPSSIVSIPVNLIHSTVVCVCVCVCVRARARSVAQLYLTLWPQGLKPTRLLCSWDSPGKNTGMGGHSLSRESPQPRDQTPISYISYVGRWILYHWTIWEDPFNWRLDIKWKATET